VSRMEFIERAERAEQKLTNALAALRDMRTLASVSVEGDPWYAEQAGLDAESIFAQADDVLGETDV